MLTSGKPQSSIFLPLPPSSASLPLHPSFCIPPLSSALMYYYSDISPIFRVATHAAVLPSMPSAIPSYNSLPFTTLFSLCRLPPAFPCLVCTAPVSLLQLFFTILLIQCVCFAHLQFQLPSTEYKIQYASIKPK